MPNDITMIENALRLFFQPGDVFEIRALDAVTPTYNKPHVESGYFDYEHIYEAAKAVAKLQCRGVYVTVNPVNPALLARSANRMQPAGRDAASKDSDILLRRWLLIDCDPVRPSGISATNEEHALAFDKAIEIREGLKSMGWPEPIVCDSGNGAQLMYRVDLPCDDEGLVQSCLKELAKANSEQLQIDQTVHNPARIWRIPGTMNCKGDSLPERPHRLATILEAPEHLESISGMILKKLANSAEPSSAQECAGTVDISVIAGPAPSKENTFRVDEWIAKHCPDVLPFQPWNGGRKWIFPVCPFNPEHTNRSAAIFEQPSGAIAFACRHNGCNGYGWAELRKLREYGYEKAKQPEPLEATAMALVPQEEPKKKPWNGVGEDELRKAIEGTCIGIMTELFASVTAPPLPLEAALLKAIVIAGCALSEAGEQPKNCLADYMKVGPELARLRIDTAGGQVANIYAMLAANSASGKDIGNLLELLAIKYNWSIGTAGSAEGIADALIKRNNGLICISEFSNWLDQRHWQHKATGFLTEAFSKGFFRHSFSIRDKASVRASDYCYPNIMANIQPDVFETIVSKLDISSGFLGRFIYCKMPEFFGNPRRIDMPKTMDRLSECIDAFRAKRGVVTVPDGYQEELSEMFIRESPSNLHPNWRRLVNEYYPRLAVMLSVKPTDTGSPEVSLDERCWGNAKKLVLWFFSHAESMLAGIEDGDESTKQRERRFKRVFKAVNRYKEIGARWSDISNYASYGSTKKERMEALCELIDREILETREGRYFVKSIPPGWR